MQGAFVRRRDGGKKKVALPGRGRAEQAEQTEEQWLFQPERDHVRLGGPEGVVPRQPRAGRAEFKGEGPSSPTCSTPERPGQKALGAHVRAECTRRGSACLGGAGRAAEAAGGRGTEARQGAAATVRGPKRGLLPDS